MEYTLKVIQNKSVLIDRKVEKEDKLTVFTVTAFYMVTKIQNKLPSVTISSTLQYYLPIFSTFEMYLASTSLCANGALFFSFSTLTPQLYS